MLKFTNAVGNISGNIIRNLCKAPATSSELLDASWNDAAFEGCVPIFIVNLEFLISKKTPSYPSVSNFHMSVWLSCLSFRDSSVPWLTCSKGWCVQGNIPPVPSPQDQLLPGCGVWSQLISWNKQQTRFRVIFAMEESPPYPPHFPQGWAELPLSSSAHRLAVGWEVSFVLFSLAHLFPHSDPCVPLWEFDAFSACGFYCYHNREHWGREENVS